MIFTHILLLLAVVFLFRIAQSADKETEKNEPQHYDSYLLDVDDADAAAIRNGIRR